MVDAPPRAKHVRKPSEPNLNKNTNWLNSKGAWAWYISLILTSWAVVSAFVDPGMAWTYVHLLHSTVSYYCLHWMKGSPIQEDQGIYDHLTFWEQLDNEQYSTATRKMFAVIPVALFLLATHSSDYRRQPLALNLIAVVVLLVAKFPQLHKVRFFGINKY
jgi:ORMDL family